MKHILLTISVAVVLSGCSNNSGEIPITPTLTLFPTAIPKTQTVSIGPKFPFVRPGSPFPTPKPAEASKQCLSLILDSKQLPSNDYGALVIDSWFYPKWVHAKFEQPYLFKAPERKITLETKLRVVDTHSFATSPDQTKIAILYEDLDAGKIDFFVFGRNGKMVTGLDFPDNLKSAWLINWLDKGMVLEIKYNAGSYNASTNYVLFDPVTRMQSNLQTSFPNHYPPDYDYRGTDEVYYDPSLTRAIYFAAEKTAVYDLYYSLWDISNNREITRVHLSSYASGAVWSKNGEFAIVNVWLGKQYGLVSVHRDGQTETILQGRVDEYRISPDSKLLAYWLNNENSGNISTLHVKNLSTGEIQDYCLETTFPVGMVWSPDSRNLAVSFDYQGAVITAIVDFEQKTAVRIDDVSIPVGWLK
jgi:hypothetical protein